MQPLQGLLLQRLDAYRHDVAATRRFKQGTGISGIGLVAFDVGADIGSGQEPNLDAQAIEPSRPVMSRTTGFHDDQRDIAVLKPALELAAGKTVRFDDLPRTIGNGQLEDAFCQIDSNGSSIHFGFPFGVDEC